MKKAFLIHWGTYPDSTLVSVNMKHEELMKWAREKIQSPKPGYLKALDKTKHERGAWDTGGFKVFSTEDSDGWSVLFIDNWDNSIQALGTIVHELSHAIDDILVERRGVDCTEAKAYQIEYLLKQILIQLKQA